MGKIRKKSLRSHKVDPIAAVMFAEPHSLYEDEELDESVGPNEVIRDQLQNANVEEKINGLQALATYTASKEKVATICQSDIIRIAAPLLCERDLSVRSAAAGALRNFSVCGTDVCNILVEQDVPTPLIALLNEYIRDIDWVPSFDANMHGEMDLRSDVFLHAINLLWNLCESSSMALDQLNQTELIEGLIRCLDYNTYGLEIVISVAQCLLVVSENNLKCWQIINEHVNTFLYLMGITGENGYAFLRSLAAGILCNVPALAAAHAVPILQSLSLTLQINHQESAEKLLATAETLNENNDESAMTISEDATIEDESEEVASQRRRRSELPTQKELVLRNLGYTIDAQRVAAEVATNLLCSDDDAEWTDADEAVNDSEDECIMDYNNKDDGVKNSEIEKLSPDTLEMIRSTGLVEKFWQRAQPLPDNITQRIHDQDRSILAKVKFLRYSTLLCLQNLCNILNTEDLGGLEFLYSVWFEVGQMIFKGQQDHADLLEPSTALMRATLTHLKSKKELFSQMTQSDLELILKGIEQCSMAEIRANWLRMLGTLGCLLTEELTKSTIVFLLESCSKESDAWTMSESLDVLMDMFAENDWLEIVRSLNLSQNLKMLEKMFKTKVRQQKRELSERYPAVLTVQQNLPRFIKYVENSVK